MSEAAAERLVDEREYATWVAVNEPCTRPCCAALPLQRTP